MNDELLSKFILSYLIDKPDYLQLGSEEQQIVFETCRTIMKAIYNAIKYDNVYPVIMCGDIEAQSVIGKAIQSVQPFLPSADKITVHLIH
jgi:hypothetical protein